MRILPIAFAILGTPVLPAVVPVFAARISGGSSAITSAQMIDPYVPVDGTMNVTGAILASTSITAGGNVVLQDAGDQLQFTDANLRCFESGTNDLLCEAAGGDFVWSNGSVNFAHLTNTVGSGGIVSGVEIDFSTADTVATDTTPVSVTGISLAIDASDTYAVHCEGTAFTALATAGVQMGLDLPASATQVATCHMGTTASAAQYTSFTADDGSCANINGLVTPGTSWILNSKVSNSTNAGNVVLRVRSETTDDVTIVGGAWCVAKKIIDA